MSAAPKSRPGMMPAMKSFWIDTSATSAYMTKMTLGGMMMPTLPLLATSAADQRLSYPASSIAGRRIGARAATVAGPEPEMAAKKQLVTTVTIARPPNLWPTIALEKLTSFSEMPPFSIMTPARIKNGMAISVGLAVPLNMVLAKVVSAKPSCARDATEEMPRQ